jgi:RNA polymerase sigma-70 factor (ECF subfamily)
MTDDSVPLILPLPRWGTGFCETTSLYRELRKPLIRYLVCLGLSSDEAQDVVQDAFLSLQREAASAGSKENIRGWLFRVAHNQARNRQNSYHRRFGESLGAEVDVIAQENTPEQIVLYKEKLRQVQKAMRHLTEAERECLLLRSADLRYREIGEVLGIPISTVADTVERAIKKLSEKCNV